VAALRVMLVTLLMGCASMAMAAPGDDADLLHRADQAVQEGLKRGENSQQARPYYLDAVKQFEALHGHGVRNPDLFRDLGNAYLLAGNVPHAILAYRRGLRFAPSDPVLQTNLTYAREQVDFPSPDNFGRPPRDDWPPWLPRPTLEIMLASAVVTHVAVCLLLTRWWMKRRSWLLFAAGAFFVLLVVPILGTAHEAWRERQQETHPLVVVAVDGLTLRNGNGMAYPARYDGKTLSRGVEARLLYERDDWLHIELAGGETGWVRRVDVLVDTP
jgi:tetratricopeptide (TPR) repeat protein